MGEQSGGEGFDLVRLTVNLLGFGLTAGVVVLIIAVIVHELG